MNWKKVRVQAFQICGSLQSWKYLLIWWMAEIACKTILRLVAAWVRTSNLKFKMKENDTKSSPAFRGKRHFCQDRSVLVWLDSKWFMWRRYSRVQPKVVPDEPDNVRSCHDSVSHLVWAMSVVDINQKEPYNFSSPWTYNLSHNEAPGWTPRNKTTTQSSDCLSSMSVCVMK